MAWGYNLQLTSVTVKGQPPAAVCIYSSGRESAAVFPAPHSLLLLSNWSLLHSFLYCIKDSFSPLHKHTPTTIPTHSLPQTHVDSETGDAPIACIVRGTTVFPCCCQNQMHCSAKSPSRLEWHLEGQKGQVRVRTFAAERRTILVSKSFYLKYSSLEESLPLVDVGWGKNEPVKPWGPVLSRLVQTFSAEQGILGEWGFLSSHQDCLLRLHSPLKPRLLHERRERACTHQSPGDSLNALLLAGIDTFLMLFIPTPRLPLRALPPTALQGCLLIQSSHGLFPKTPPFMNHPLWLLTFSVPLMPLFT